MSDILIKGFDFPEDCSKCPLRKVPQMRDDICVISGCRVHNYPERPSWCYLHEVKPHGRLIDADRLADDFEVYLAMTYPFMQNSVAEGMVDDVRLATQIAPTILEATE